MKTTRYFEENVIGQKRQYIKREWCEITLTNPDYTTIQADVRVRYYRYIEEAEKFIRVVTLEDGITIHNAFFDRNFKPQRQ